jgi:ribosomal protein S18 acetylase RimI-like enzyme
MPHTVRQALPDDAEAIVDIQVRGWQWAYDGLVPADHLAGLDAARPGRVERFRRYLTEGPVRTLVVLDPGDRVIGFANCGGYRIGQDDSRPVEGEGEVYAIYVDPAVAGTGAGRAIMDAAVARLTGQGLRPIHLWVLEDNARARRFYERYGFALAGDRSMITIGDADLPEVRYTLATDGQPDQ